MKIVAIIQARMGSTRLPGKVMKEVLGKSLLEYQIERVRRSQSIQNLIVATTQRETEQPIIDLCEKVKVPCYRGAEEDVLERFYEAAIHYEADAVVRLTSDCPLIDPLIIDKVVNEFRNSTRYDYVSNTIKRTYPRGFDIEVFSMDALKQCHRETTNAGYREHVTPYLYKHPERFIIGQVTHSSSLQHHRLTVDTEEDLLLVRLIIEHLYKKNQSFSLEDILYLLQKNPKWNLLNSHVEQKDVQ
ncbi:glycosyltransferase family protein [Peribacillus psychrosaccharolyticus]|uniref:Glycosyltransferase family protein n=1 Tax=Peribacillus psychrosaccharolyticus TaxID=1407 RepID=A0A974NPU7_PERPY|nr:glycosyltransferase family protein [Peribacillus psychrosaccharolyticus]MEC2057796.1 glycosyltransferase family protein [Peribacillus psychrosaccharolyticus]MED3746322.1 glycosyltransferase family protein [Peribacillus psychrosaccharolyticus]QQT01881.1 glycosyltransferase family protein [Peribacillus psychrosaccharolyticus]